MPGGPIPILPVTLKTSDPKPNRQASPGSVGNTTGLITPKPSPNGAIADGQPTKPTDPPAEPETPKEKSFWGKISGGVHTGLDVLGFVPGLGAIPDLANAGIYALEGDMVNAGISTMAAVPGIGDAAKAGTMVVKGGKAVAKEAAKEGAEKAAKEAAEKAAKEAAEKAEKEAAEKAAKEKAEKETAEAGGKPPKKEDGGYSKGKGKGPCDHLRQGDGTGPYRGGAHNKTSKPVNDEKDSHHMPAKDASPLRPQDGPAIQMHPNDHAKTSSNGQMPGSIEYREMIADLIADGKWREAMVKEIKDVRRVADEVGDPKKYNEATLEMLEYFKCLEKHGLLR
jgi:hypothetical protein